MAEHTGRTMNWLGREERRSNPSIRAGNGLHGQVCRNKLMSNSPSCHCGLFCCSRHPHGQRPDDPSTQCRGHLDMKAYVWARRAYEDAQICVGTCRRPAVPRRNKALRGRHDDSENDGMLGRRWPDLVDQGRTREQNVALVADTAKDMDAAASLCLSFSPELADKTRELAL